MELTVRGFILSVLGVLVWIFILYLIFPSCAYGKVTTFSGKPLYEEPLAYKRSVESGFSLKSSKYLGKDVEYFEAMIGKDISLITWESEAKTEIQFGLIAGTWLTLGYKDGAFPLLTQDFLLSAPVSFRYKKFSCSLRYNHISAHLGDGMDRLIEDNLSEKEREDYELYERIADSAGVGISLKKSFVYSRDFISLHADYRYRIKMIDARNYIHGGYAVRIFPEELEKYFLGSGFEIIWWNSFISPYVAYDITYNADVNIVDLSIQAGTFVLTKENDWFTMRVAFTGHIGSDRRGQLLGRKLRQIGVGLFIR